MKCSLSILVSLSLFFALPAQAQTESGGDCLQSKLNGQAAGEAAEDGTTNLLLGCVAGACCGPLGCLGAGLYGYTKGTSSMLRILKARMGRVIFRATKRLARKKRTQNILIGGAISAVVIYGAYFAYYFLMSIAASNNSTRTTRALHN